MGTVAASEEGLPGERRGPLKSNEPIRVLHFISHLGTGGGPYHILRHLNAMGQDDFGHIMVSIHAPYTLAPAFEESGIPVIRLDHRGGFGGVGSVARIANVVRRQRIDVIHSNTRPDRLIAHPAAALTSRPVVNTLRSRFSARFYAPSGDVDSRSIRRRFEQTMYRRVVRQTVAIAEATRDEWVRSAPPELRSIPIEVVYPGIDVAAFDARQTADRDQLRRQLSLEDGGSVLLYVARLEEKKGHRFLIEAMSAVTASHPDAVLLLAGDGTMRPEIESQIAALDLSRNVRLLGFRDDVPDLLSAADIFVFPSLSEGFGVALLEAASAGLPIVTFGIEPFDEWLVDGESGYFASFKDVASLAGAVRGLLDDPELAKRMGERNRRVVEDRMDVHIWAGRLADIYRRLAAERRGET